MKAYIMLLLIVIHPKLMCATVIFDIVIAPLKLSEIDQIISKYNFIPPPFLHTN